MSEFSVKFNSPIDRSRFVSLLQSVLNDLGGEWFVASSKNGHNNGKKRKTFSHTAIRGVGGSDGGLALRIDARVSRDRRKYVTSVCVRLNIPTPLAQWHQRAFAEELAFRVGSGVDSLSGPVSAPGTKPFREENPDAAAYAAKFDAPSTLPEERQDVRVLVADLEYPSDD